MTTRLLGIDPGLDGALAVLTDAGELEVADLPRLETERGSSRHGPPGPRNRCKLHHQSPSEIRDYS
jgi:hypothetical protein